MGFDTWLVADPDRAVRFATLADIELAFEGLVLQNNWTYHYLEVGTSTSDSCELRFSETDPQLVLGVSRLVESDWLWERLFQLLTDFDLFMWWGDAIAVVAREEVPTPPEMALKKVRVTGGPQLRSAVFA